jgi:hypothetical protein
MHASQITALDCIYQLLLRRINLLNRRLGARLLQNRLIVMLRAIFPATLGAAGIIRYDDIVDLRSRIPGRLGGGLNGNRNRSRVKIARCRDWKHEGGLVAG